MKVEFSNKAAFGDGKVLTVQETEFRKAGKDKDEYDSLKIAVNAFNAIYALSTILSIKEYKAIDKVLKKNGTVLFIVNNGLPRVYVSNNGIPEEVFFPNNQIVGS